MEKYFVYGPIAGTPHTRYAVLDHGCIVQMTISRPEGQEVPRPHVLRWRHHEHDVQVREYLFNNPVPTQTNGQQPRKPGWSGRRAVSQ